MKHILFSLFVKFRLFVWSFLFVFLGLFLFYSILSFRSEALIVSTLKSISGKVTSVKRVNIYFPFTLTVDELRVGEIFQLKRARASLNVFPLLLGRVVFNDINIIEPRLNFSLNRSLVESISSGLNPLSLPSSKADNGSASGGEPSTASVRPDPGKPASSDYMFFPPFAIDRLRVKGGQLSIIDRNLGPGEEVKLNFKDIQVKLESLSFIKKSSLTKFNIHASIPWDNNKKNGELDFSGWMDFVKMDMSAQLDIKNIDGIYFRPYYSSWIDLESAKIKGASLNFRSDIKGYNDDITAKCALDLADIEFYPKSESKETNKAERVAAAVIDAFRSVEQGKISLNFTLHTKMHKPQLGVHCINSAVQEKLANKFKPRLGPEDLVILPVKFLGAVVKGMVKGTAGVSKTFVDGTLGVGTEVKNAVKDRIVDKAAAKSPAIESIAPVVANSTQPAAEHGSGAGEEK